MRKELRGFVLGVVLMSLLLSSTAVASVGTQTLQVLFNSVNLKVNGKSVSADNILYNGTTYVPLRAISEMLDKDVQWEQSTKTASINDKVAAPQEPTVPSDEGETLAQKNAVAKAKSYLAYTSFSKTGLIKQLEFEGFSNADATYAVNKITVDWNEQAVKKAKSYLEYSAFSRSGLIKQLEFEGFTNSESVHAVDTIGL